MDDYVPLPSDFLVDSNYTFPEDPTFLDPRPLPDFDGSYASFPHEHVETSPAESSTRKRRSGRRTVIPNLPPLPVGEMPKDGDSRFDWRKTASSQMQKATRGKRWYPHLTVNRHPAPKAKLTEGDTFYDEVTRYRNHFLPLLHAEHAEEQRLFNERLKDWSLSRLKRDGFALTHLKGNRSKWPAKQGGTVWEFRQFDGGKEVKALPFHRFTSGQSVILSRTTPLSDAILENGTIGPPDEKMGFMHVQVYSSGTGFIRLQAENELEDVTDGFWRLDVGLNPYVLNVQKDAIMALNNDPVAQDVSDVLRQRLSSVDGHSDRPEQTILAGTALRDKVLRAFQQDFIPYESTTALATSSSPLPAPVGQDDDGIRIVNDGIVAPQHNLNANDVDAIPVPRVHKSMSGTLIRNEEIRSWAERHRVEGEVKKSESDPDVPLNPSQLRAIAMMISERLSLVQGPPGTGKTRVIIETIKLLKKHWKIPHPILVTAHTNVAVDNIVAGLRTHDVKALRVGNPDRVRPDLHPFTFDTISVTHPLAAEVEHLLVEREELYAKGPNGAYIHPIAVRNDRSKEIAFNLHRLRAQMFTDVLHDSDVICTTCLSAASQFILKHIDFPIVFLDEASMATEPLSLIPLMKGSSHVAIIGDHKQLPPVIISESARAAGLATSLFERLIHERHVPSIMLDTQYRMHPDISAFASKTFYNSDLRDGTVDAAGNVVTGFGIPESRFLRDIDDNPSSMMFLDHDHPESPEMKSIANHGDAAIICDIVADILFHNPDMSGSDIGIVAPYTAQIRALHQKLQVDPYTSAALADVLGPVRALEVQDIEIKTVDGFEGREKQVIIFSATRCNAAGYIGFLADWRRLNVAITRAKRGLIIVGSAQTLEQARISPSAEESLPAGGTRVWREFMAHLRERGLIRVHQDLPLYEEDAEENFEASLQNEEKDVVDEHEEVVAEVAEASSA